MMRAWLAWHRWAGVIACAAILAWSLSGVLHPVMSRLQPQPAVRTAPVAHLPAQLDLQQLLATQQLDNITALHPAVIDGHVWLRVSTNSDVLYLDPASSTSLENGEEQHARFLARHFSGEHDAAIVSVRQITAFNDEYPYVNRLLPVWRVEFDRPDHLRAFVDTAHSRLGTLTDDRKLWMSQAFTALHTWGWADGSAWRLLAMTLLLLATASTAIAGMVMAIRLRNAKQRLANNRLRLWHRRLAIAVSLSAVMFSSSGLYHLWHTENPHVAPTPLRASLAARSVQHWPVLQMGEQLSLHVINHQPVWRISGTTAMPAEHAHHQGMAMPTASTVRYISAIDGRPIADGEQQHVRALVTQYSPMRDAVITDTEAITAFAGEYGFINKRLPVMRADLDTPDHTSVYVETATDELATIVTDADRTEGWSFAWLHKWHFLDINKDVRDALLALFAFGNALVALMGLWLFIRR